MTSTTRSPHERAAALVDAALALQQAGDRDAALEILTRAQAMAPDYASTHMLIGLIYQEQARWEEAEARFRRVLELEPDNPDALQSLGLLLLKQGPADDGLAMLRRHLALKPADPTTLKAIAGQLLRRQQHNEAVQLYDQAWQLARRADIGLPYGRLLLLLGSTEKTEEILGEIADTEPTAEHLTEYAMIVLLRGRPADAVVILARALAAKPDFAPAWRGLSSAHLAAGQPLKALEAAERLLALDGEDCRNWLTKANVLLALRRYEEVLEAIHRGADCVSMDEPKAQPTIERLRITESKALQALKKDIEALDVLEEARQQFPKSEAIIYSEIQLLNALDRPTRALQLMDEAATAGVFWTGRLAPARFETLHLLGSHDGAWDFIAPLLAERGEQRLRVLSDIGVSLYTRGRVEAAKAIFSQLHEFSPQTERFSINLGFILTGDGELQEAENYLLQGLATDPESEMRPLTLADLGYLHLIQRELPRANAAFEEALSLTEQESKGILRIAYWRNGDVQPDDIRHPSAFIPLRSGILANQVTLKLAQGDSTGAAVLAKQLVADYPELAAAYMVCGWFEHTVGQNDAAHRMWAEALARSNDEQQQQVIAAWLHQLAG